MLLCIIRAASSMSQRDSGTEVGEAERSLAPDTDCERNMSSFFARKPAIGMVDVPLGPIRGPIHRHQQLPTGGDTSNFKYLAPAYSWANREFQFRAPSLPPSFARRRMPSPMRGALFARPLLRLVIAPMAADDLARRGHRSPDCLIAVHEPQFSGNFLFALDDSCSKPLLNQRCVGSVRAYTAPAKRNG